jgi:hypothetical protein
VQMSGRELRVVEAVLAGIIQKPFTLFNFTLNLESNLSVGGSLTARLLPHPGGSFADTWREKTGNFR